MNLYLASLLIFAIPANIVAGIVYWLGRKERLKWSPVEYLLIYLTWGMVIALTNFAFENLDNAARQLAVSQAFLIVIFVVCGIFGGLSLAPRLFFAKYQQYAILITSISSFIFAVLFVKFAVLIFLVAG